MFHKPSVHVQKSDSRESSVRHGDADPAVHTSAPHKKNDRYKS